MAKKRRFPATFCMFFCLAEEMVDDLSGLGLRHVGGPRKNLRLTCPVLFVCVCFFCFFKCVFNVLMVFCGVFYDVFIFSLSNYRHLSSFCCFVVVLMFIFEVLERNQRGPSRFSFVGDVYV